ncbi:MAG: phosphotransferase [Gammaproteobacteria bacterium]|nr:phosphotransferase [Gammaproteobacteria bacterium]MBP7912017.1 phosphotransferase [Pseudomonadales bacterium]
MDFDTGAFGRWLAGQTGQEAELTVEPIRGGASCELFRMTRLGARWIIRRAPKVSIASGAHDVVREARIIRTLHGSAVPVPEVLAASNDSAPLGAPFFIMEYIDGEVLRRGLPQDYLDHPDSQPAIGEELIDRLADLHAFDWRHSAAADPRPAGFRDGHGGRSAGRPRLGHDLLAGGRQPDRLPARRRPRGIRRGLLPETGTTAPAIRRAHRPRHEPLPVVPGVQRVEARHRAGGLLREAPARRIEESHARVSRLHDRPAARARTAFRGVGPRVSPARRLQTISGRETWRICST